MLQLFNPPPAERLAAETLLLLPLFFQVWQCVAQNTAGGEAVLSNQCVIAVTLTNGGSGYSVPPTVTFLGGDGSGATAVVHPTNLVNGSVLEVSVISTGSGYTSPPTVVIEPPLFDLHNTLVGYWPFETTVEDTSAYHQHGTVVGTISYPEGPVGTAAAISGSSYVEFGDPSDDRYDIAAGEDFSAAMWVRTPMSGSTLWYPMLLAKDTGWEMPPTRVGWCFYFSAGANCEAGFTLIRPSMYTVYGSLCGNDWHHIAAVKKGTVLNFYLDGEVASSTSCPDSDYSTSIPLRLGKSENTTFATYQGAVDELRIYKRALEPREVKGLFARLPVIAQPQSALVHLHRTATFSTTATGTGPFAYQWLKNGQPLPQETNAVLKIVNAQTNHAGLYSVMVSNQFGTVYSQQATLSVYPFGMTLALYPGITIEGIVGETYGIQCATDLTNTAWIGLANITLTSATAIWHDPQIARSCDCDSVSPPKRFYRVVQGPVSVP